MKTKLIALTAILPVAVQADQGMESLFSKKKNSKSIASLQEKKSPSNLSQEEPTNRKNVFFVGDFIYWRAQEEGLEYALSGVSQLPAVGTAVSVKKGKLFQPDFKFEPGFKLGAGYILPEERKWEFSLLYTWLHSQAKSSHTANLPADIAPLSPSSVWPTFCFPDFARSNVGDVPQPLSFASGKWRLDYQTLDLDIARAIQIRNRFLLKPHVGLRGASIDQKYDIHYVFSTTLPIVGARVTQNLFATLPFKNNFLGIGIRAGLDNLWQFSPRFGVFANLSASVIYGRFKTHQKETETKVTPPAAGFPRGTGVDVSHRFYKAIPELDIALGLHAETPLEKGRKIEANISWEQLLWFNQNQLFVISDIGNIGNITRQKGNLSMGGLTFDVRFHF